MINPDLGLNSYVLLVIAAPFGELQQVSSLMTPAEAAATAADIKLAVQAHVPTDAPRRFSRSVYLKEVKVVRVRKDPVF